MRCINAVTVNEALATGLLHLHHFGVEEESRNGPVYVSKMPVITVFKNPHQRVLVNERRDPNPFFHLFEALWMLGGRNDLAFPQKFISTFGQFSDDGQTLHGAYGARWRSYFGYDQLDMIISALRNDPKTRRAVLAMWDGGAIVDESQLQYRLGDLHVAESGGKDVPCNTHIYFDTVGGHLNMTTVARGLDVILGAYGANAVHMSILHEYVASLTGLPMGVFRQYANNYHAYRDLYPRLKLDKEGLLDLASSVRQSDPYSSSKMRLVPLMNGGEEKAFHNDLREFLSCVDRHAPDFSAETPFFTSVVRPMWSAWRAWKEGDFDGADVAARNIVAYDWFIAAQSWLEIRRKRREEKING